MISLKIIMIIVMNVIIIFFIYVLFKKNKNKKNYFEPDIPKVCDLLIPNSQWSVLLCAAPEVHRNVNFRDLHRHQLAAAKKAG